MKKQNFSKFDLSSPEGNAFGKLDFAVRDGITASTTINQGVLPWFKKLIMGLPILFLLTPQWSSAAQVEAGNKTKDVVKSQITDHSSVRYGYETVEGLKIFYREAGKRDKPVIVLLHGFPASSHMYRDVLAGLAEDYYLIAPDYPGFGNSSFPAPEAFDYTFDNLAQVMEQFLEQRGIDRFSIMIQDYGAPIGFRLAVKHPDRIQAIITQNGNAYKEGLSVKGWGPIFDYWKQKTPELETTIAENVFTFEGMKWHKNPNRYYLIPGYWLMQILPNQGKHGLSWICFMTIKTMC